MAQPHKAELRTLARALRTLSEGQGRVSRRNARGRVLRALRAVRRRMDADYPPIARERIAIASRRTPEAIRRALEAKGWRAVTSASEIAVLAGAGVRVRNLKRRELDVQSQPGLIRAAVRSSHITMAPGWAVAILETGIVGSMARLIEARKSPAVRKAVLVEAAMCREQTNQPERLVYLSGAPISAARPRAHRPGGPPRAP